MLRKSILLSALLPCALLLCVVVPCAAQEIVINLDESKVAPYALPDPLAMQSGKKVANKKQWMNKRRPELLRLFETEVYGKAPGRPAALSFEVLSIDREALGGAATRKEINVYFTADKRDSMTLLIYLPNNAQPPAPLFFGLNFKGNHSVNPDPGITPSVTRMKPREGRKEGEGRGFPRSSEASRWPIEMLIANGYGVATVYRGDIDPDYDDGFQNGVHPLYYAEGQTRPAADQWATLAAWSWGMSRAMDYFETDKDIDAERVAIVGHSRHGKATLWAGATDQRFALVISNDSGCGGASLSKRDYGETVARINKVFPYWFCENFRKYSHNEAALPVDQHELIALIAPRPVYIASAIEDTWADPKGEFLSGVHATPVYELFGLRGLSGDALPAVDSPSLDGHIGHHVRSGGHDINLYDWQQYVKFADLHFKKPQPK